MWIEGLVWLGFVAGLVELQIHPLRFASVPRHAPRHAGAGGTGGMTIHLLLI
jgi:hypothetical protein